MKKSEDESVLCSDRNRHKSPKNISLTNKQHPEVGGEFQHLINNIKESSTFPPEIRKNAQRRSTCTDCRSGSSDAKWRRPERWWRSVGFLSWRAQCNHRPGRIVRAFDQVPSGKTTTHLNSPVASDRLFWANTPHYTSVDRLVRVAIDHQAQRQRSLQDFNCPLWKNTWRWRENFKLVACSSNYLN